MRCIQLGADGPTVSAVGLGASHFGRVCDLEQTCAIVDAATVAGISFIDTAAAYPGSEELLGRALRGKRHQVVISSKFGHPHNHPAGPRGSRDVLHGSLHGSLSRLQTDYLDVFVMHLPDPLTPLEETLTALRELVAEGLIRWFGLSNFSAAEIARAEGLTCVQERYNLLNRTAEEDILPVCRERGIGMVPAVPLASGLLTGKYSRNPTNTLDSDAAWTVLGRLRSYAEQRDVSLVQLAIGWLAAQPGVGPIITGATRPEHITANALAGEWQPAPEELDVLNGLSRANRRVSA